MPTLDDSLEPITDSPASNGALPPDVHGWHQIMRTAAVVVVALCLIVIAVTQVRLVRYQAQGICAQSVIYQRSTTSNQGSAAAESAQRRMAACFD